MASISFEKKQDLVPGHQKKMFSLNCQLFAQQFSGHRRGALGKESIMKRKQEVGESLEQSQRGGDSNQRPS